MHDEGDLRQCLECTAIRHRAGARRASHCFDQDQELDRVRLRRLRARLGQNGVQEKLTKQWIDRRCGDCGLREEAAE